MNRVGIIRQALSVYLSIGAAAAILLISQTALAIDRSAPAAIDNAASTSQKSDPVSDHLYRSLLIYNAGRDLFPALNATTSSDPGTPGGDSVLPPVAAVGLWRPGSLGTDRPFASLESPAPRLDAIAIRDTVAPDSGGPGQRSRKTNLAPGTSPMTPTDKFNYFLRKSFMPPWPYAMSIVGGVVSQALDTKDKKHRENAGEFMVGSLEHAARSFAFRTTANFFEKFAYASLFKQDPRYHPSENQGFGSRLGYAISRVFVTQGDHGGNQFNASFLLGGLTAAGISNAWEQDKHVNVQDTFKRWGTHIGITALTNVMHELFRR